MQGKCFVGKSRSASSLLLEVTDVQELGACSSSSLDLINDLSVTSAYVCVCVRVCFGSDEKDVD